MIRDGTRRRLPSSRAMRRSTPRSATRSAARSARAVRTQPARGDGQRESLPRRPEPMLATLGSMPADPESWRFEEKWDGYRALVRWDGHRISILSLQWARPDRAIPGAEGHARVPPRAAAARWGDRGARPPAPRQLRRPAGGHAEGRITRARPAWPVHALPDQLHALRHPPSRRPLHAHAELRAAPRAARGAGARGRALEHAPQPRRRRGAARPHARAGSGRHHGQASREPLPAGHPHTRLAQDQAPAQRRFRGGRQVDERGRSGVDRGSSLLLGYHSSAASARAGQPLRAAMARSGPDSAPRSGSRWGRRWRATSSSCPHASGTSPEDRACIGAVRA